MFMGGSRVLFWLALIVWGWFVPSVCAGGGAD